MEVTDIIAKYDKLEAKGISLKELGMEVCAQDAECTTKESQFEKLAFLLIPYELENPWPGYYYGPFSYFVDAIGNAVENPPFAEITSDAITYWESRYRNAQSPLIKMQYAGLVWDFKRKIAKKNYDADLYGIYVSSMLDTCNQDYCQHPVETVEILERAFGITKSNSAELTKVKQAYKDFEKRHASDDAPGLWSSQFMLMLQYKNKFTAKERTDLVKEHEQRLIRLSTQEIEGIINPRFAEEEAELLAEYYKGQQSKEDIKRVFNIVETTFARVKDSMSKFQYAANVEHIVALYRHYGLEDEAVRLTAVMQKLFSESKVEMESFQTTFDIPKEVHDQADVMFGEKASSDEERWNNFARYFIPRKKEEEESLKESGKKHFFLNAAGTQLMDPKGRPMSKIGTLEQDFDGNLAWYIAQKLNIQQYFLAIAINRLITSGTLTTEKVMQQIKLSPIFEGNRYAIIEKAMNYFVEGEYIMFSHLIVPQIENAICNIVEMCGETVLRPQKDRKKGYQLKTLDDLLRQSSVVATLTDDGAYYLRLVLSDQKALNIRNLLCHGVLQPEYFDSRSAGRLLHVLIMLSLIRLQ